MATQLGHWHIFYGFVANVNIRTFVGKYKKIYIQICFLCGGPAEAAPSSLTHTSNCDLFYCGSKS